MGGWDGMGDEMTGGLGGREYTGRAGWGNGTKCRGWTSGMAAGGRGCWYCRGDPGHEEDQ